MANRLGVIRLERYPDTDRDPWGQLALAMCFEMEKIEGVVDAKYWWVNGANDIAIQIEAEDGPSLFRALHGMEPRPDYVNLDSRLQDLSRVVSRERWVDPHDATIAYRAAGR